MCFNVNYYEIRKKYLKSYYCHWPSILKFTASMSSNSTKIINCLAKYIFVLHLMMWWSSFDNNSTIKVLSKFTHDISRTYQFYHKHLHYWIIANSFEKSISPFVLFIISLFAINIMFVVLWHNIYIELNTFIIGLYKRNMRFVLNIYET